jgi:hypothetical protein
MAIYARRPWRLAGQVTADVFVVVWAVVWWLLGDVAQQAVLSVAGPARDTATTAGRLSAQLGDAAEQASRVPAIGEQLRQPFDAASLSLTDLVANANQQVLSIERVADLAQWLVFGVPVAILLALWLPRRIRFVLRARAAQRFLDSTADLDLFALRAMTSQPLHVLARISPDPVAAWRAGDATVIHKLAEVELRRSGLRMPVLAGTGTDEGPTGEG